MRRRHIALIRTTLLMLLAVVALTEPTSAQGLPKSDVEKGKIPGAVILVAREGKFAHFETIGFQDREKQRPMRRVWSPIIRQHI